jgi:hypothetical protein
VKVRIGASKSLVGVVFLVSFAFWNEKAIDNEFKANEIL